VSLIHTRLRRPISGFIATAALAACALAASAYAGRTPTPNLVPSPLARGVSDLFVLLQVSAQQEVETEVITLRPSGFEPAEIVRPAGRVMFAVDNRSGAGEVVLRLARAGGDQLNKARASRNTRALREVVNLAPGEYTLTETGHTEWVCRITITH